MCKMETDKNMKRCGKMESKTVIEWLESIHREVESDSITNRRKLKKSFWISELRSQTDKWTKLHAKQRKAN